MYIAVMHARRCERLAFLDVAAGNELEGRISPLCIPVRDDKPASGSGRRLLREWIKSFSRNKVRYFLLTTPYAAKVPYGQKAILEDLASFDAEGMALPFVAVTQAKPLSTVEAEIGALGKEGPFGILHVSESQDASRLEAVLKKFGARLKWHVFYDECSDAYSDRWDQANRALVHDGFVKLNRNADYVDNVDEDFSDVGFKYKSKGFQAYGDHTICGEDYTPGGARALAVAIHVTFQAPLNGKSTAVKIRHFVSDDKTKVIPEGIRYLQARKKLLAFYKANAPAFVYSSACNDFDNVYGKHPGLPKVKELSIRHHLEMMLHLGL